MHYFILALPEPTAPSAPGGGGGPGNLWIFLLPILILFLLPLFNKKEKHRRKRLAELKKHDRVVTSGGIFGTVTALDEGAVTIEIAKDVRIKVKRSSIFDIEGPKDAREAAEKSKAGAKS